MNKRIVVTVVILAVVVIAAIVAISIGTTKNPNNSADTSSSSESSEATSAATAPNDGAGTYVEYSESVVAEAEGRVILFFHAPWCPQCVSIDGDIKTEGVPSGVTIVKVDYDSSQDLRAEYGVTQQTTFVEVDSEGEKLQDNFVAYANPTLQTVLNALL